MSIVSVLVGFVGLIALLAIIVLAMRGAERLTARLVGLSSFRWFDARDEAGAWWKRLAVRAASSLAPFLVSLSMFFVVYAVGGYPEATTTVTVLEGGAAQEAGLRDGDKVVAIGGVRVQSWDELRANISTRSGPTLITLERAAQRLELSVTPRDGRIGVSPRSVMRPASFGNALSRAARLPLQVVEDSAKAFLAAHQGGELKGAVGIARETGDASGKGPLTLLFFLGVLGAYSWPFAASVHLFDAATGWVFRMTFTSPADSTERGLRVARLRFTLYCSLACWLAALLCEVAVGTELVPGAMVLLALTIPGVWALFPLVWVSAKELWGKSSLLRVLLPLAFLPCAAPLFGIWLALQLRQEERNLRSAP